MKIRQEHKLDVAGLPLLVAGASAPDNEAERGVHFTVTLLFPKESP